MRYFLIVFSTMFFLTSCGDCIQEVKGTIIDSKTGKPIPNIKVYKKESKWVASKTDSSGKFELSGISGGLSCPPMIVIIKDNNYKKIEVSIDAGSEKTIKLEPIK